MMPADESTIHFVGGPLDGLSIPVERSAFRRRTCDLGGEYVLHTVRGFRSWLIVKNKLVYRESVEDETRYRWLRMAIPEKVREIVENKGAS
jgi:hypothetical protein